MCDRPFPLSTCYIDWLTDWLIQWSLDSPPGTLRFDQTNELQGQTCYRCFTRTTEFCLQLEGKTFILATYLLWKVYLIFLLL